MICMYTDKNTLEKKFSELENTLTGHTLPSWDDFPDIELYMDQVISLIRKYLEIHCRATGAEKLITPSMINNYVKLKIIPPPQKKKYSRIHLAYLIIICTLKQSLDMATIQKILPLSPDEQCVRKNYSSFVESGREAAGYAAESIRTLCSPLFSAENSGENDFDGILAKFCSLASIYKMLTEGITKISEPGDD